MGIFQQQFNSVLSSALRTQVAGRVKNVTDDWIAKNTGKNWDPKTNKTSQGVDEWSKTGLPLDDASILDDVLEAGLKSMPKGEIRDTMKYGVQQVRQTLIRKHTESQMALEAAQARNVALENRLAAKPYKISDKQFAQEFNKRAKPIVHGGNK